MKSFEQTKVIREDGEFRGMVIATLKSIQKDSQDLKVNLTNHLEEEMIELKEFNQRLKKLEGWKIQVTAMSSVIGTIIGFALNKLL